MGKTERELEKAFCGWKINHKEHAGEDMDGYIFFQCPGYQWIPNES
jgi:hypothetical protein